MNLTLVAAALLLTGGSGSADALPQAEKMPVKPLAQVQIKAPFPTEHGLQQRLEEARAARAAAAVDPGILILPDPALDAKIKVVEPQGNVDPAMVLSPRHSGYYRGCCADKVKWLPPKETSED